MKIQIFAVNQKNQPKIYSTKALNSIATAIDWATDAKKALQDEGDITQIRVWVEDDSGTFKCEV